MSSPLASEMRRTFRPSASRTVLSRTTCSRWRPRGRRASAARRGGDSWGFRGGVDPALFEKTRSHGAVRVIRKHVRAGERHAFLACETEMHPAIDLAPEAARGKIEREQDDPGASVPGASFEGKVDEGARERRPAEAVHQPLARPRVDVQPIPYALVASVRPGEREDDLGLPVTIHVADEKLPRWVPGSPRRDAPLRDGDTRTRG